MIKDGIINIYKEQGMTSHDVCWKVKKLLGVKKAGHTGTLDPMATGVLPICVGRATRVMQFMESDRKMYRCEMTLGLDTDTYDIWGEVTSEVEQADEHVLAAITEADVADALSGFLGEIMQEPPKYSAVKVNGKRLYEYARKGRDVEIPVRRVVIDKLELVDFVPAGDLPKAVFDIWCSKGTFVRSICHDAGEKLGVHAVMSGLERRATGVFTSKDAVTLGELAEMSEEDLKRRMKDPDIAMDALGIIEVEEKDAIRLINGLEIEPACYRVIKEPEQEAARLRATADPEQEQQKAQYRVYSRISEGCEIPGRPNGTYEVLHPREDGKRFIGVCDIAGPQRHLFPGKIFI